LVRHFCFFFFFLCEIRKIAHVKRRKREREKERDRKKERNEEKRKKDPSLLHAVDPGKEAVRAGEGYFCIQCSLK